MSKRKAGRFTKDQLLSALENNNLSSLNLRLVQFESLRKSEVQGALEEDLIQLIYAIRDKITGILLYDKNEVLKYIKGDGNEGFDVTALFPINSTVCIGAAISLFYAKENTLLSHLTAVHENYQIGYGVGEFLRRAQLSFLRQTEKFIRAQQTAKNPLQFFTLAAKGISTEPDLRGQRGAVVFNRRVFEKLKWTELTEKDAINVLMKIDNSYKHLNLKTTFETVLVQPLLFCDTSATNNEESAQSTVQPQ
eukprot:6204411-Pleurochrysis_carterae.AAC.1